MMAKNAPPLCPNANTTSGPTLRRVRCTTAALLVTLLVGMAGLATLGQVYSHQELIEDARQLLAILEENHPDPYVHGGGKIAFHLRFQEMLASIPEDGMTAEAFSRLLVPFVASVGDGHTDVWARYALDRALPGGIPLRFEIVEQSLYVAAVVAHGDRELLGATLVSVEGVTLDKLRQRQRQLRGIENELHDLLWLLDGLWYRAYLHDLIPEWTDCATIDVTLRLPDGSLVERSFRTTHYAGILRYPETALEMIDAGPYGFATGFLDDDREIAILRVDDMTAYREVLGRTGGRRPEDISDAERASTPSATEVFRQLIVDMKAAGTETLLIDLRNDMGGASLMADILVYFLYGMDGLHEAASRSILAGGGQIERVGPLEMKFYSDAELAEQSAQHSFPFEVGDYKVTDHHDFYEAYAAQLGMTLDELAEEQGHALVASRYTDFPEFAAELAAGTYGGTHTPRNVIALVRPRTYSSGFTLMQYLDWAGATLVGTPSAQAAYTFGEGLIWTLDHTGIQGMVAHNWYVSSPDDLERGRVWPVDVEMTYAELAEHGFDPNTEMRMALEWVEAKERQMALTQLETQIASIREALRIPGLSAAVVRDGEVIWAQGFGIADVENQIAATPQTPYGLASVTKPFAATLLMKLAEGGHLDLDTPASEFGIDLGNDAITVRHLLSHTSEGVPGSRYRYSGDRYSSLTTVIEQLYGDSFRSVLRREILEPLEMNDTALNIGGCGLAYYEAALSLDDPEQAYLHVYDDAAVPYQYDSDYELYPASVPTYANAAAGLISTVTDLARFAAAIEDNELVSKDTKAEMFAPTVLNSGMFGPYGLGWFTETVDETRLIWHYGYGAYSTLFLMVPEMDLTFIVLANTQNLSRPFGLGMPDVSVLGSPVALAFYKAFVLDPCLRTKYPEMDWAAGTDAIVAQLATIEDARLRELASGELWTYRKLYAGIGRNDLAYQLLRAHYEAFPDDRRTSIELHVAGPFGPRPVTADDLKLSDTEAARWVGRYTLRAEDAAVGLPLEIELMADAGRITAIPVGDACQVFTAVTPTRLVSGNDPNLFLVGQGESGPFAAGQVEYKGEIIATYERVE